MSSYEASVTTNLTNFIPGSLDSLNNPERHVKVNRDLCGLFVKCECVVYNPLLQISRIMVPYRNGRLFPWHIETTVQTQ